MKKLSILAFSVCFTLIAIITNITHSQAFERHVPGIYSTIQETINAAGEGDIIILEPATYHENIWTYRIVELWKRFQLESQTN